MGELEHLMEEVEIWRKLITADEEAWTFNRRGTYVWRGTSIMVDGGAWTFEGGGTDLIWRKALTVDEGVWTCCFRKRWGINRR